jgi:hypothetical protein
MTSTRKRMRVGAVLTAALAVVAIATPAAQADPPQGHSGRYVTPIRIVPDAFDRTVRASGPMGRADGYQPQLRSTAPNALTTPTGGFAWSDAALGAAAGFALGLALLVGATIVLRNRGRVAHA